MQKYGNINRIIVKCSKKSGLIGDLVRLNHFENLHEKGLFSLI